MRDRFTLRVSASKDYCELIAKSTSSGILRAKPQSRCKRVPMTDDAADVIGLFDMLSPKRGRASEPIQLIYSSHVGTNAEIFPSILKLHVNPGGRIADVTYGKGAFWKFVPKGRYTTVFSDMNTGKDGEDARIRKLDCRKLPYD